MSANHSRDRASLCSFTFVDGRRCRIPRRHGHPYLCTFHAREGAKIFDGEKVGEEIARYLSGEHVPAGDLCSALGRLFAAIAQGEVEPKTVAALAPWADHSPQNPLFAKSFRINTCKSAAKQRISNSLESVFTEKRGGHTH